MLWLLAAGGLASGRGTAVMKGRARWLAMVGCGLLVGFAWIELAGFDRGSAAWVLGADWAGGACAWLALVAFGAAGWVQSKGARGWFAGGLLVQALTWPAAWISLGWAAPLRRTDFLPLGTERAAFAVILASAVLVAMWRRCGLTGRGWKQAPWWLAAVLVAGVGLMEGLARLERAHTVEQAWARAKSLALGVDTEAAGALVLNENTHRSEPYRLLRAQLQRLRRANPDIAYLYLVMRMGDRLVYPVSGADFYYKLSTGPQVRMSEPEEPYEVGPMARGFYAELFAEKGPLQPWVFEEDPVYGGLLSVYAPLSMVGAKAPRVLLGMDLPLQVYLADARQVRRMAQMLTLASIAALLFWLRQREDAEAVGLERARNEFLGKVGHELQTPVHAIMAHAAGLRDVEAARAIERHAGDLQRLVEDLLQASALRSPVFQLQPRRCRLPGLLREAAVQAARQAEAKGLRFTENFGLDLPELVVADPLRLRQVVVNLLSNAVKYTPFGEVGLRAVRFDRSEGTRAETDVVWVGIAVSDTGPGLPSGGLAKVSEPFYRELARGGESGAGLGLAVAQDLTAKMGGSLTAHARMPRGTEIMLTLPLKLAPAMGSFAQNGAVLVVEDHPTLRLHLAAQIEGLGRQVVTAGSVSEGLAAWKLGGLTVALIDQQLPDGTGAELTARIRSVRERQPWIIGMSASREPAVAEAVLAAGADDFLYKPITREALESALSQQSGAGGANVTHEPVAPGAPGSADLVEERRSVLSAVEAGDWNEAARRAHYLVNSGIATGVVAARLEMLRQVEEAARRGDSVALRASEAEFKRGTVS